MLGTLPLGLILFLLYRQRTDSRGWERVCDAHLLPHLLVGHDRIQSRSPYILLAVAWALCLLALAGPVWSKLPQPVFRAQSALVLVLDLSRSMDAEDIRPSRLTRAKHKVLDILKQRQEGQTALVVFSGEPYVVSPLTEDSNTIAAMVPSLDTTLMPVQGSRPDLALLQAKKLLEQSDIPRGNLLLITDGIEDIDVQSAVEKLKIRQHRISVLGIGTIEGAPIPQTGGFVKDEEGAIVIPKLNPQALAELARIGGGQYATITIDDQDLEAVLPSDGSAAEKSLDSTRQRTTELWREEGPWIVLGVVALAIPAFRPGWLGMLLITYLFMPSNSQAFFSEDWWYRPDQQGARAMEKGDPRRAATLFQDSSWKGVANYRSGNFQEAVENFSKDDSPDGHFNRGNALARSGKLREALQAYQTTLQHAPTHKDAQHNYELIETLLKQQEQRNQSDSKGDPSQGEPSSESEQSEGEHSQESRGQQNRQQQSRDSKADVQSKESSQSSDDTSSNKAEQQAGQSTPESTDKQEESNSEVTQQPSIKSDKGQGEEGSQPIKPFSLDAENDPGDGDQKSMTAAGLSKEEKTQRESQQAMEQWLRRIPDDPGGLLRRKFLLEHRRRQESGQLNVSSGKTW